MTRNVRKVLPAVLLLLGLVSPMHISSRAMDCILPEVRAYVEEGRATLKVVATIQTKNGDIIDWVDYGSQLPDSEWATDPSQRNAWTQPPITPGELEDGGPPGTVPILRPNLRYACGLTLKEWLDGPNTHGGMRNDAP